MTEIGDEIAKPIRGGYLKSQSDKKKVIRTAAILDAPVVKKWPVLPDEREKLILDVLDRVLRANDFGRLREKVIYPKELKTRKEKNEFKKKILSEHWRKGRDMRCSFVMGMNQVTKSLEKNQLVSILVSSDIPLMMKQHLIGLCLLHSVPAASIRFGNKVNSLLGLKSCVALGFKAEVKNEGNILHAIYRTLVENCLPLTDHNINITDSMEESSVTSPVLAISEEEYLTSEKAEIAKDWSYFYIYKDLKPKVETIFMSLDSSSFDKVEKKEGKALEKSELNIEPEKVFLSLMSSAYDKTDKSEDSSRSNKSLKNKNPIYKELQLKEKVITKNKLKTIKKDQRKLKKLAAKKAKQKPNQKNCK